MPVNPPLARLVLAVTSSLRGREAAALPGDADYREKNARAVMMAQLRSMAQDCSDVYIRASKSDAEAVASALEVAGEPTDARPPGEATKRGHKARPPGEATRRGHQARPPGEVAPLSHSNGNSFG